jgi:RimJ/RimL family protein N-acetyltransferase
MKKSVKAKKSTKAKKPRKTGKPKVSTFYAQSKRLGFRLLTSTDKELYVGLYTDAKTLEHVQAPLTIERAEQSFQKALTVTAILPLKQRITVIVERGSKKPIGIAGLKLVDADSRRAECGILLKPTAHAQRFALEGSLALIDAAFKRHTISEISAQVTIGHKAGERLVKSIGYDRGPDLPPTNDHPARSLWSITREKWADTCK